MKKKLGSKLVKKGSSYCDWCECYTGGARLCPACKAVILKIIGSDSINKILKSAVENG